jgi:hypothetical protein
MNAWYVLANSFSFTDVTNEEASVCKIALISSDSTYNSQSEPNLEWLKFQVHGSVHQR